MRCVVLVFVLLFCASLGAQNFLPNGDFEAGKAGWTNTRMTDTAGSVGIGSGPTTTAGDSNGVYGDFKTLTSVYYCNWTSAKFMLPPFPSIPVRFDVSWVKKTTAPIPSPSVNRVQFWVKDAANAIVFASGMIRVPNQTGLVERVHYAGNIKLTATVPAQYYVEIQMRHSNLAGVPYRVYFDNIVIGNQYHDVYGFPCAGTGNKTPKVSTSGIPNLGSTNWQINVSNVGLPAPALAILGHNSKKWSGLTLPFNLGGGCSLNAGMTWMFPVAIKATGSGTFQLPIPNNSLYLGLNLFSQFLIIDPGSASPLQLIGSSALKFTILK